MTDMATSMLADCLRPGDRVLIGQACGEPVGLVEDLFELAARLGHLNVFCGYSLNPAWENHVPDSLRVTTYCGLGTTGKLLARRARQYGTFGADTRVAAWTVGAEAQFSGYRYDNDTNTTRLGGYSLLNLYASTPLSKDWTILARVNNLADKNYQLANTYTTPGRSFYTAVRWAPP